MNELLKQLTTILGNKINSVALESNDDAMKIFDQIKNKSDCENKEDPIMILFYEFSKNGYSVLSTIGRDEPYENKGDYILVPWNDNLGHHNKYDDSFIFENFEMGHELKPDTDKVKINDNGDFIDLDGDLIFDAPNPEKYDIVLIRHVYA